MSQWYTRMSAACEKDLFRKRAGCRRKGVNGHLTHTRDTIIRTIHKYLLTAGR
jgi:hypothetical protein